MPRATWAYLLATCCSFNQLLHWIEQIKASHLDADLVTPMENNHGFVVIYISVRCLLTSYMQAYSPSSTGYSKIQSMNQFADQIL
ncbi:hypothetical protein H5410_020639 [Solanum commersonii]|uniref:Uncharacterized protein n=1 Tax=Solanum commersonii TaxID=4109 RepID=A0A9J5ZEV1_SOLCO|nr:hypothetical protein H5410_020639 [Solanum commersonii]